MVTRLQGQASFTRDSSLKPFQRGTGRSSTPFEPSVESATHSSNDPLNSLNPDKAPTPKPSQTTPSATHQNRSGNSSNTSGGQGRSSLNSVIEQSKNQKISIESILEDFQKTMDAMGADAVRDQTTAYLNVVALEAQKDKPSVSLIKQVLRTAADGLDGYIKQALRLDKPSRVVREWVDALLMQPVEFQAQEPSKAAFSEGSKETSTFKQPASSSRTVSNTDSSASKEVLSAVNNTPTTNRALETPVPKNLVLNGNEAFQEVLLDSNSEETTLSTLPSEDRVQLAKLLQESRLRQSLGEFIPAKAALEKSLGLLQGKNQPTYEANVLYRLGKLHETFQHVEAAMAYYQKASSMFESVDNPEKKANVLYSMATLGERQQNFEMAQTYYEQALAIEKTLGNDIKTSKILNVLGMLHLQKNTPDKAVPYFKQATETAVGLHSDPTLLAAIYNNLGAAYKAQNQKEQSLKAYQSSLKAAQENKDWSGIRNSLNRMASLYLDSGATDRAMKLLSWAQQIPA